MPRRCGTQTKKSGLRRLFPNVTDAGETIYLWIRYVNIYKEDNEKLTIAQVKANHDYVNDAFQNRNDTSTIATLRANEPNRYNFTPASFNVTFLPLTLRTIEYVKTTKYLSDTNPLEDAANAAGIVPHVINVYIGSQASQTDSQMELGSAVLGENRVYVNYRTIGSPTKPGLLPPYHLGATLVHELGHVLFLEHPFDLGETCATADVYSDIPAQLKPNEQARLIYTEADGDEIIITEDPVTATPTLIGLYDHRQRDYLEVNVFGGKTLGNSCLSTEGLNPGSTESFENAFLFMDYSNDTLLSMFSAEQVRYGRTNALAFFPLFKNNQDRLRPSLFDSSNITSHFVSPTGDGVVVVSGGSDLPMNTTDTVVVTNPTGGDGLSTSEQEGLTSTDIALYSVIGGLVVVALLMAVFYMNREKVLTTGVTSHSSTSSSSNIT